MSFTLIIAEKPNAAQKISQALAEGKIETFESSEGVKYYSFSRNKKKHVAVAAVGHIFSLKGLSKSGWDYPVTDYEWKPTYEISKKALFSKKYFDTLMLASKGATDHIIACDFDIEGSVIGYNILRFICGKEKGKRMKFSTLTKQDLIESYDKAMTHLDTPQIETGLTRHELDFLWGVNMTRALTLALKKGGKKLSFFLLTAGRVQTPMLHFLMQKEKEIKAFKPDPYWQIEAKIQLAKDMLVPCLHKTEKFWKKDDAENAFKKSKSMKDATVLAVDTRQYKQNPPTPFDLTTLQTEAYRFFGWSPKQTTNIAQSLYEKGFISYPRTSSQKLPPQIGYKSILENLAKISTYKKLASHLLNKSDLKPLEGAKDDPAHPAVYPTAEVPNVERLRMQDKKLYDLIARRFMSVFGEPAVKESVKISFDVGKEEFSATGRRTVEKGWTEYYGRYAKSDETIFPQTKQGDKFKIKSIDFINKETSPPPRFSQGSIVRELEKHNLGTKTTRAQILQSLYDREYISGKSIEVTGLGMKVAQTLEKYVPDIVSEKLTRKFEKDMEKIEHEKGKRESVVNKAKALIRKISVEFKKHEETIGAALEKAILETREEQSQLGSCPICDDGDLKILFSPLTKKRFVGCSNYNKCAVCGFSRKACKCICPKCGGTKGACKCTLKEKQWTPVCSTGYPLPLQGSMTNTGGICEKCHTPIIQVWRKGRRPFRMCLAPDCETKKDWKKPEKGITNVKEINKQANLIKKGSSKKKIGEKKAIKNKKIENK